MFAGAFRQTRAILRGITGNSRACLIVEPLWGIPFNLYTPYTSLYMLALGATPAQVGLITATGLVFQMGFALLSGHVTDRLGRHRTSLIFDVIGWSIPTLLWALAGGLSWFFAAAIINAAFRVVHTSWNCLLIEDSRPDQRVHIYTWVHVAGILAGFFAPLAGLLVGAVGLVPAVRGLYAFAFVSMTSMFFIRNHFTTETRVGVRKMAETKEFRLRESLADHKRVLLRLVRNPYLLAAFVLLVIDEIYLIMHRTYVAILLTRGLGFSEAAVAVFPAMHSVVMLVVFVFLMPYISRLALRTSIRLGLLSSAAGYVVLLTTRGASFGPVILGTALGAFGMAVVFPTVQSIVANAVEENDRAKTMAILNVFLFGTSAPFSYLGGFLAGVNPRLPFVLLLGLLGAALALTIVLERHRRRADTAYR